MTADGGLNAKEIKERDFQLFVKKLLTAQQYGDWLDEQKLFTPATLAQILRTMCGIIADETSASSCTVHLKLRDATTLEDEVVNRWIEEHLGEHPQPRTKATNARRQLLRNSLCFPYWKRGFGKGVSWLVAASGHPGPRHVDSSDEQGKQPRHGIDSGPWHSLPKGLAFAHLGTGISKDIYQDNVARQRDALQIRETRNFEKLGGVDYLVWTNQTWDRVFRNYYGVPIRIHSAGEVVGILKVENKLRPDEARAQRDPAGGCPCRCVFCAGRGGQPWESLAFLEEGCVSQLSRHYLGLDTSGLKDRALRDALHIPIPRADPDYDVKWKRAGAVAKTLCPSTKRPPPVQLFAGSLAAETALLTTIGGRERVAAFYDKLSARLVAWANSTAKERSFRFRFDSVTVTMKAVSSRAASSPKLPAFHFALSVEQKKDDTPLTLYAMIPPRNRKALGSLLKRWPGAGSPDLKAVIALHLLENPIWFGAAKNRRRSPPRGWERLGRRAEFIEYHSPKGKRVRITDLLLDRLAARTQAFVFAQEIPEFTETDTHKLGWAAYEMGRLIEREISYRANRHDDPMPLTAMEFCRIPISDLSFVDNLRRRRQDAIRVASTVDAQLRALASEMRMDADVQYTSRIKEYRSYLQRLGERYEGYYRGNLTFWLYVLAVAAPEQSRQAFPSAGKGRARRFGEILKDLRTSVQAAIVAAERVPGRPSGKSLDMLEEFESRIKRGRRTWLADLRLISPPVSVTNVGWARKRLVKTLLDEGLVGLLDDGVYAFRRELTALIPREQVEELLFRNHSEFAQEAVSLLFQLENLRRDNKRARLKRTYGRTYRELYWLRGLLCATDREIFQERSKEPLKRLFLPPGGPDASVWQEAMQYVETVSTEELTLEAGERDLLRYTVGGIYKRVRTLLNVLRRQRPAAAVEWDLHRFDLYGARMNCLYKNQEFALYEHAWNRGDPFFWYDLGTETAEAFAHAGAGKPASRPALRQHWLCLRTNVLEGDYNALQIAGLVDPRSLNPGHWSGDLYTTDRLKTVLGVLFQALDKPTSERYRNYAFHRNRIRAEYARWYARAEGLVRPGSASPEQGDSADQGWHWFGAFLFEGVIDALMLLSRFQMAGTWDARNPFGVFLEDLAAAQAAIGRQSRDLAKIVRAIARLTPAMAEYSTRVRNALDTREWVEHMTFRCGDKPCFATEGACRLGEYEPKGKGRRFVWHGAVKGKDKPCADGWLCDLYRRSAALLTTIARQLDGNKLRLVSNELQRHARNLQKEERYFRNIRLPEDGNGQGRPRHRGVMPLIHLDEGRGSGDEGRASGEGSAAGPQRIAEALRKIATQLEGPRKKAGKWNTWRWLYRMLKRFRRDQRAFLFYEGGSRNDGQGRTPGLGLRGPEEVLWRIRNYVLLFRPEEDTRMAGDILGGATQFDGWNAHDLYYYVRSLIPFELQVRTQLANTFAVQYHDAVYKGRPPEGTDLPRAMMQGVGNDLDSVDCEMEVDYEDFILRSALNDEKEEESPQPGQKTTEG